MSEKCSLERFNLYTVESRRYDLLGNRKIKRITRLVLSEIHGSFKTFRPGEEQKTYYPEKTFHAESYQRDSTVTRFSVAFECPFKASAKSSIHITRLAHWVFQ